MNQIRSNTSGIFIRGSAQKLQCIRNKINIVNNNSATKPQLTFYPRRWYARMPARLNPRERTRADPPLRTVEAAEVLLLLLLERREHRQIRSVKRYSSLERELLGWRAHGAWRDSQTNLTYVCIPSRRYYVAQWKGHNPFSNPQAHNNISLPKCFSLFIPFFIYIFLLH